MGVGGASRLTEKVAEILDKYPGGIKLIDSIEYLVTWARANSLWPLVYGTACCAMEMMATGSSRHDWARFGVEVARATPRQADLIILAGTIVEKMGSNLITLYKQMPAPKYVIAMGSCAISGGPFYYDAYSVIKGGDRLIPVDVYVPGCPPRPEALLYGIMELQKKIKEEGRRKPWKIGKLLNMPFIDPHTLAQEDWALLEQKKESEQQQAREQFKIDNPDYRSPKPTRLLKEKFAAVPRMQLSTTGRANEHIFSIIQNYLPTISLFRQPDIRPETVAELGPEYILDLEVEREHYLDLVRFLKEDRELGVDMLLQLTAVDWHDHFDIIVHLLSSKNGYKIFLRSPVAKARPEIATIATIFLGAEWHEREVYDLFGICFTGHPDMRRLFLKDDFPGHPLCKDFEDPERVVKRPY
ncbi:NADH-ubiquinone oxidoreductase chain B [hydrothermal vent metagenome]|uniref:NADH-ubiquinone oxidoreductase chain B n=1 Tax=hydrothermal vent metagenome TaxID=652676 RepID=A0A3B0VMV4_9ZZZZ